MAYYRGEPVRTAFGRPMSSRTTDTPGLAWVFLLLMVGGVLTLHIIAQALRADASTATLTGRLLGPDRPERVRVGFIPPAEAAPPSADTAAVPAPPAAGPVAQPTVAPTAVPTRAPDRFRVANTDGVGVVLHTAPRRDARVPRGLMEGARVTVVERMGTEWARVRSDDGQEGWVGAAYLVAGE
jgi:hypothetical protein